MTVSDPSNHFGADPQIEIEKRTLEGTTTAGTVVDDFTNNASDGARILVGEAVTWIYQVTSVGNVDLSNVSVTDDQGVTVSLLTGDDGDNVLEDGETWYYTAEGTAAVDSYNNIGTASGSFTDSAGDIGTDTETDASSYFGADPQIAIEKRTLDGTTTVGTVAGDFATAGDGINIMVGEAVTWIYQVTSVGNVDLSNVSVTDDQGATVSLLTGDDGDNVLEDGETWYYTAVGTAAVDSYNNVGMASGSFTDDAGASRTDIETDASSYLGADPQIAIEKRTLDGTTTAGTVDSDFTNDAGDGNSILIGEAVTWIYQVTSVGNVDLSNVNVTDDQGVTVSLLTGDDGDNVLESGETWYYTAVGTAAVDWYNNIGTASGSFTDTAGHIGTDIETDGSSYFGADPQIAIEKRTLDGTTTAGSVVDDFTNNASDGANILVGEAVTWIYQVSSVGNVDLSNVSVTDDQGVTVSLLTGDDGDNVLEDGETWYYTAVGTAAAGSYNNIGTASGSFTDTAGHIGTDTETDASSYLGADPQIAIEKRTLDGTTTAGSVVDDFTNDASDGASILIGEAVTWIYQVASVGNVDLSNVSVTDDQGVTVSLLTGDDGDNVLEDGETWYYTAEGTAAVDSYNNVGTASGSFTDSTGHTGTDTETDASSYLGADPQIDIEKRTLDGTTTAGSVVDDFTNNASDGASILIGEAVTWIYQVASVGNVDLSNVSVTDDQGVTVSLLTGDDGDNVLEDGETWYYTA